MGRETVSYDISLIRIGDVRKLPGSLIEFLLSVIAGAAL